MFQWWGTTTRIHTTRSTHVPSSVMIMGRSVSPVPRIEPERTSTTTKVVYQGARNLNTSPHTARAAASPVNREATVEPQKYMTKHSGTSIAALSTMHTSTLLRARRLSPAP